MSFTHKQNLIEVENLVTNFDRAFEAAKHFNPAYDRILIKREKSALERKVEKSGLVMADTIKENYKSAEGVLVKCGPTADVEATSLIGKRILFAKYGGEDIVIPMPDGSKEEFVLATDTDIFGQLV
jgi:co-chaperonin GroES (HSP10)